MYFPFSTRENEVEQKLSPHSDTFGSVKRLFYGFLFRSIDRSIATQSGRNILIRVKDLAQIHERSHERSHELLTSDLRTKDIRNFERSVIQCTRLQFAKRIAQLIRRAIMKTVRFRT